VGGIEGVRDRNPKLQQLVSADRLGANAMFQRLPFQQLHHEKLPTFMLTNVVNRADVGMFQCQGGSGLTLEAFHCMAITGQLIGQEFQGDLTAEPSVLGLVDDAHTAATELLDDAVMRDSLANHGEKAKLWGVMLGARKLVVNEADGGVQTGSGKVPSVLLLPGFWVEVAR
jgi:hypothetical protein